MRSPSRIIAASVNSPRSASIPGPVRDGLTVAHRFLLVPPEPAELPPVIAECPRAGHDAAGLSCSLAGVFLSAVRQPSPQECQAARQPHIPARCPVELVRAHATEGGAGTMTTRSGPGPGRSDRSPSAIMSERRQLINLAYRLLGSLAEAEDAVQETYARWYAMSRQQQDAIQSARAWLTTVTSRICLNLLGSARARRETYVGAWIPEPLPEPAEWSTGRPGSTVDPADRVTLDESVGMAFLVVLESLTPAERVAFILHDVFGYSFAEVAGIVGRRPAGRPRPRLQASLGSPGHRRPHRPARPRRHGDRRQRRPGRRRHAPPDRRRRADRPRLPRRRPLGTRPDDLGAHGQRPARAGGPARRRHRDGVRV